MNLILQKRNYNEYYWLYGDVPGIITHILKNGAEIAIVSQNKSKALYVVGLSTAPD